MWRIRTVVEVVLIIIFSLNIGLLSWWITNRPVFNKGQSVLNIPQYFLRTPL